MGRFLGLSGLAIELLPIGYEIIEVRKYLLSKSNNKAKSLLRTWIKDRPWIKHRQQKLNYLKITNGAFSKKTEKGIGQYLSAIEDISDTNLRRVFRFALLCILEEISYTRKDGQYLRWDFRSGRKQGAKPFDKGIIKEFNIAITSKLEQILKDLEDNQVDLFGHAKKTLAGDITVLRGSCLELLPNLKSSSIDFIMTSPPYANRYDYTRTYALELSLLGADEGSLKELRQSMLSCTVENRVKENLVKEYKKSTFIKVEKIFERQELLQATLRYLSILKEKKELNNPGIVRMVKNYFFEMALVIFECSRIMKRGAVFIMVNDNVRYAGVDIPVDLILSEIAIEAGLSVDKIWVLPKGKGNSSQQMGTHGRKETRKCVYVWKKLKAN
jgi:hypothetical protein